MNNQNNSNKNDFVSLFLVNAEHDSRDKQASKEFLLSEGLNTDKLIIEGMKRIKKMQLLANARRTEAEMGASQKVRDEAIAWVDALLSKQNFSITDLIKSEELSLSFRNLETKPSMIGSSIAILD